MKYGVWPIGRRKSPKNNQISDCTDERARKKARKKEKEP